MGCLHVDRDGCPSFFGCAPAWRWTLEDCLRRLGSQPSSVPQCTTTVWYISQQQRVVVIMVLVSTYPILLLPRQVGSCLMRILTGCQRILSADDILNLAQVENRTERNRMCLLEAHVVARG